MSRAKELVKNTFIITIGKFSTQFISFLLLPLYTNKLSPEDYGNYDYIITIAIFLVPIITLLLEESMFRFLIDAKTETEKDKIISNTFIYSIFSMIIIFIILWLGCKIFNYNLGNYIILYTFSSTLVSLANALARGEGKIKLFSISNFVLNLINIVLSIVFILVFKLGFKSLIMAPVMANSIVSFFVYIKMDLKKYISLKKFDYSYLKEMIKYSIPLVPNTICWSVINLSDRLFIVKSLGTFENGIYSISYKFPNILNNFYNYFNTAWRETSAKIANDGNEDIQYKMILDRIKKVLFSMSILLIAFIPYILPFLIDSSYKSAIMYIPILTIAVYYSSLAGFYGGIFTAFKDTKILGYTSFVAAVANIAINLGLIHKIGIMAAAVSTLISSFIIYEYRKIKSNKYVKISSNLQDSVYLGIFIVICIVFYVEKIRVIGVIASIIIALYSNKEIITKIFSIILKRIRKQ